MNRNDDFLVRELGKLKSEDERRAFLERHSEAVHPNFVDRLSEGVIERAGVDADAALALAQASHEIALELGDEVVLAKGLKAMGNALYERRDYRGAVEHFERAARLFEKNDEPTETARALLTSLQARILLGDYESAFDDADRARIIFEKNGEEKLLAMLDNNVGNILHRQDRFREALVLYERSYRSLLELGDAAGAATALGNLSGCLIMLNDFPRALEIYRAARKSCEERGMSRLVARADYNIAYMFYLRGEYSRSIDMLNTARLAFKESSDAYHVALCDMDQAEIYIDLNLYAEAARLASRARKDFSILGTGYEQAKSMALEAIALSNQGRTVRALDLFERARASFVSESNQVWPGLIDLYRAIVYGDEGRIFEARKLARQVLPVFEEAGLWAKAIVCRLLLARLALRMDEADSARRDCEAALDRALAIDSPLYVFQGRFLMGEIQESEGLVSKAFQSFEAAAQTLESLRSSLQREEMKIAFLRNRLGIYEAIVDLRLTKDASSQAKKLALHDIERSKARALVDVILGSIRGRPSAAGESEISRRAQDLREELNWYYRRIEHEQLSRDGFDPERLDELSKTARSRENELLDLLRELPEGDGRFAGLQSSEPVSLDRIVSALGPARSLVEYYIARGRIYACVVTEDGLDVRPLDAAERVKSLVQRLQLQLAKFQLPPDYVEIFGGSIHETILFHLSELYESLVAPLRPAIEGRDLVVVPHSFMHYLPFHALFDGERYVIDDCAVSYAPSASVYVHCRGLTEAVGSRSLVLGVSDPTVPFVREEARAVANSVPEPELLFDADASLDALRAKASQCRLIHIATHGYYRKDNPMFSAIRLGDSYLSLYDLYELSLPVDLVTVSACATGSSVVVEGDEILGLVRGLLYAGARSLIAALWNVQDRATASLMASFYSHLRDSRDRASALRCAMLQQRETTPQPYFWAPYVLVGKTGPD